MKLQPSRSYMRYRMSHLAHLIRQPYVAHRLHMARRLHITYQVHIAYQLYRAHRVMTNLNKALNHFGLIIFMIWSPYGGSPFGSCIGLSKFNVNEKLRKMYQEIINGTRFSILNPYLIGNCFFLMTIFSFLISLISLASDRWLIVR